MLSEDKYFKTLSEKKLWERYCGFLDLSVEEWMDIQNELLMDEIDLVADSTLGKKIMGKQKPNSPDEFRRIVPLTSYDDYEPYLSERDESALAVKPEMWCHSSGKGGRFKWYPLTPRFLERGVKNGICIFILASTSEKGRVNISPGVRLFFMLPPPPYASGCWLQNLAQHFSFKSIPDPEKNRGLQVQDRIRKGFQEALSDGVDIIGALGSVLVKMGEQFEERPKERKLAASMLHPKIASTFVKALLRSRREARKILPKDLWPTKAIITSGVDTAIYKDTILRYWGSRPYEFYTCAEAFFVAMHGWDKREMIFPPDMVFFEFIPHEELRKQEDDKDYQPSTVLLNQLEAGKLYEIVITHFYGGPLLRYRMNDIIKVVALEDNEAGVNLPQIAFQRKVGELINLGGLAQLDEKTIWQAIANTGIEYTEWTACKEYEHGKSFIRLYLELKKDRDPTQIATMVDEQLKQVDTDYKDIDEYLELQPVGVTLLSPGTFERYTEVKRREGADPALMKPPHINPTEAVIQRLLQLSEENKEKW